VFVVAGFARYAEVFAAPPAQLPEERAQLFDYDAKQPLDIQVTKASVPTDPRSYRQGAKGSRGCILGLSELLRF
jgi:hypothetical protein